MEELEKRWEEILLKVKNEHNLTDITFYTWLKPLKVYSVQDDYAVILFASEQTGLSYLSKKFALPLKAAIAEVTGMEYEIVFIMPEQAEEWDTDHEVKISQEVMAEEEKSNSNPYYTFESFVVGNNNRFAYSASLTVAEDPGNVFNPLFIYGGSGLGKTHLMHSIAHHILQNNPSLRVLYVSPETFTDELIEAIRNGNNSIMTKFRNECRNVDALFIDDIQFIAGKESAQEEFFQIFNELYVAKKQIVIAGDRPPKEMGTLEARIRSRFERGLFTDVGAPDYATRMAILRKKQEQEGSNLSDDILNYIAINIKSNVRELEGALYKLIAYSSLTGNEITMDIAVKELQDIVTSEKQFELTPQLITKVVSEYFSISVDQMMARSRNEPMVSARQIAMYLCRTMADLPEESIGLLFDGREISVVSHGIGKVRDRIRNDNNFRQTVEIIREKINEKLKEL